MACGLLLQAGELYPTRVRNSAFGLCSAWARVTSVTASILPSLLGSRGTLATVSLVCAVAAALAWLEVPETVGCGLPEELPTRDPPCRASAARAAADKWQTIDDAHQIVGKKRQQA